MQVLRGRPCTIVPQNSQVILHVPEGLLGVILGNVYENIKTLNYLVKETDCIVSPMCEFELHSIDAFRQGVLVKIQVPHIVKNPNVREKIRVISRDRYHQSIEYAEELLPEEEPPDSDNIYYRIKEKYIEIFTHHFSQYIAYAEDTTFEEVVTTEDAGEDIPHCCSKNVELLVFTKWIQKGTDPLLEVILHMCSSHYEEVDYRQVCAKISPRNSFVWNETRV